MQDAMTKTIPIWAAVLNMTVGAWQQARGHAWDSDVHLPLWVPASEQAQISSLVAGWAAKLEQVLVLVSLLLGQALLQQRSCS